MRLDNRHPGTWTAFIDSTSGERLLQVANDEDGVLLMAYHLYDERGALVAESSGLEEPHLDLTILSASGNVLLNVPAVIGGSIRYRLYGKDGGLLTVSDGLRTRIYPCLRMEGIGRHWTRPVQQPAS